MKISTKKEIEEFINRQTQLADNQIVTLSVNPEHVFGGEQGGSVNQKCKNRQAGCQISTNEKIVQTTKQEAAVELLILASAITSNISFGIGWGLLSPSYINFFHYEI